ncbi:hypothetical protein Hanom_Chr11g01027001 [Helianthus anomalus]
MLHDNYTFILLYPNSYINNIKNKGYLKQEYRGFNIDLPKLVKCGFLHLENGIN